MANEVRSCVAWMEDGRKILKHNSIASSHACGVGSFDLVSPVLPFPVHAFFFRMDGGFLADSSFSPFFFCLMLIVIFRLFFFSRRPVGWVTGVVGWLARVEMICWLLVFV